jgi:hypothetical protein
MFEKMSEKISLLDLQNNYSLIPGLSKESLQKAIADAYKLEADLVKLIVKLKEEWSSRNY